VTGLYTSICICGHQLDDHFQQEMWDNDELVLNCGQCLIEDCDCEMYSDITEDE